MEANDDVNKTIEYVYLIWPAEYVDKEPIYKLGRSDTPYYRIKAYRNATLLISCKMVLKSHQTEKVLKEVFATRFGAPVRGYEYFMGNVKEMYLLFEETTVKYIYVEEFIRKTVLIPLPQLPKKGTLNTEELTKEIKNDARSIDDLMNIAIEHPGEKRECPKCNKIYSSKHRLKQHLMNQTKDCRVTKMFREKLKNKTCEMCGEEFSNGYIRNTHMKICSKTTPL